MHKYFTLTYLVPLWFVLMCTGWSLEAASQVTKYKQAYEIYNAAGKKVSYRKMFKEISQADAILFGELHNDPIAHWLQHELAKDLSNNGNPFSLTLEMFETDQQKWVEYYLKNKIDTKLFEDSMRLWPNYKTDYKPVVEFAKSAGWRVIGANCPRQAARMVARNGMDKFADAAAAWKEIIAPLPISIDTQDLGYREMRLMMDGSHGMSPEHLIAAQALKDATMAHFIVLELKIGRKVLHLNGEFHSKNFGGVYRFLKQYDQNASFKTISVVEAQDTPDFDPTWTGRADFLIVVSGRMTKTY